MKKIVSMHWWLMVKNNYSHKNTSNWCMQVSVIELQVLLHIYNLIVTISYKSCDKYIIKVTLQSKLTAMNIQEKGTVLLVMDIQNAMMSRLTEPEALLSKIKRAITYARSNDIPVIYVTLNFRKGYPEVDPRNKLFTRLKESGLFAEGHHGSAIHPMVAPYEGEVIIIKKRISAFAGSDLEILLKAQNIGQLIITGYSTSGVVLNTVREAADKDYQLTVLSDACTDADPEVHVFLTTRIFPTSAKVITTVEWTS